MIINKSALFCLKKKKKKGGILLHDTNYNYNCRIFNTSKFIIHYTSSKGIKSRKQKTKRRNRKDKEADIRFQINNKKSFTKQSDHIIILYL